MVKFYFSIIIPTLNEEKFLPRLLCDLAKQKENNFETIIVDGNSSDDTISATNRFKDKLPYLKVIESDKRNLCYQRNLGGIRAKGKYLIFLDADVQIYTNYLKHIRKTIEKSSACFLTSYQRVDGANTFDKFLIEVTNYVLELLILINKPMAPGYNFIIRKSDFLSVKGFDEKAKFGEDHELSIRIWKKGTELTMIRRHLLKWSFRRLRKDGRLPIITKYTLATVYVLLFGRIDHTFFNYPMGGLYFSNASDRSKQEVDKYISKIRLTFNKLFNSIQL